MCTWLSVNIYFTWCLWVLMCVLEKNMKDLVLFFYLAKSGDWLQVGPLESKCLKSMRQLFGHNSLHFSYLILFLAFQERSLRVVLESVRNSLCRWDTHRDTPSSASRLLGLKMCDTTSWVVIIFKKEFSLYWAVYTPDMILLHQHSKCLTWQIHNNHIGSLWNLNKDIYEAAKTNR